MFASEMAQCRIGSPPRRKAGGLGDWKGEHRWLQPRIIDERAAEQACV